MNNLFKSLLKKLRPEKLALDCGANVGEITQKFLDEGMKVIAFEPNPFAYSILKNKFNGNDKVECINRAVWHKNDVLNLYLHKESSEDEVKWSTGSSLLSIKGNVDKNKFVRVEVIDLLEFLRNRKIKYVDILKIDIEGAEVELLERIIDEEYYKKIGQIYVETHDHKILELKIGTDRIRQKIAERKIKNIDLNWV